MARASDLRVPGPLSFDGDIAEDWRRFEMEFRVYAKAALKWKDPAEVAQTLLHFAGREAMEREKTFVYQEEIRDGEKILQQAENKEDPETLMRKFWEHCNSTESGNVQIHGCWTGQESQENSCESLAPGAPRVNIPSSLTFKGNIAEEWRLFEEDFRIYAKAALQHRDPEAIAYTLLCLAGFEAMEREKTFVYHEEIREGETIVQPAESKEDPETLMRKFREHCNSNKNTVVLRYLFWRRRQRQGESTEAFIADIRKMAADCDFGQMRDEMIRDKIVFGIQLDSLRYQMFKEKDLTLVRAIQLCLLEDSSTRNHTQPSVRREKSVDARKTNRRPPPRIRWAQHQTPQVVPPVCKRCGRPHPRGSKECQAIGKQCHKCGKLNHFARSCRAVQPNKHKVKNQRKNKH